MHTYRDTALVLRCQDLAEADRIITLLTAQQGLMRMVAKGVRRTRSKFGARLEVFNSIDVMLLPSRKVDGLGIISSVTSLFSPSAVLASDYGKYTASCVIVEVAGRLAGVECSPSGKLLRLTINALNALAEDKRSYQLIVLAYLLRATAEAGWLPELFNCAVCGEKGPHAAFYAPAGGTVCLGCRSGDYSTPGVAAMHMMHAVYMGKWDQVLVHDSRMHRRGVQLFAEYFRWHIGRGISSLSPFLAQEMSNKTAAIFESSFAAEQVLIDDKTPVDTITDISHIIDTIAG